MRQLLHSSDVHPEGKAAVGGEAAVPLPGPVAPWLAGGTEAFIFRLAGTPQSVRDQARSELTAQGPAAVEWFAEVMELGFSLETRLIWARLRLTTAWLVLGSIGLLTLLFLPLEVKVVLLPFVFALLTLAHSRRRQVTQRLKNVREGAQQAVNALTQIRSPRAAGALLQLLGGDLPPPRPRAREAECMSEVKTRALAAAGEALSGILGTEAGSTEVRSARERRLLLERLKQVHTVRHGTGRPESEGGPVSRESAIGRFSLAVVTSYRWVTDAAAVRPLRELAERGDGPPHFTPRPIREAAALSLAALEERLKSEEASRTLPRPSAPQAEDLSALPLASLPEARRE